MPSFFTVCRLDALLNLSCLAHTITQVVQLCTTDLALTDGLDHSNVGRVHGENLLAAHAVGDTTNGDGLTDAAVLTGDNGAFEHLDTLTRTFLDAHMNTNGVADLCFGQLFLMYWLDNAFTKSIFTSSLYIRRSCGSFASQRTHLDFRPI